MPREMKSAVKKISGKVVTDVERFNLSLRQSKLLTVYSNSINT
jgi:hypothetical protein